MQCLSQRKQVSQGNISEVNYYLVGARETNIKFGYVVINVTSFIQSIVIYDSTC